MPSSRPAPARPRGPAPRRRLVGRPNPWLGRGSSIDLRSLRPLRPTPEPGGATSDTWFGPYNLCTGVGSLQLPEVCRVTQ